MALAVCHCGRDVIARGLCPTHYAAARRAGQFQVRKHPRKSLEERLAAQVDQSGGPEACWPWTGAHNEKGYGLTYRFEGDRRVTIGAHKAMYEAAHGRIEDGLQMLHSCHNPPCCNHAHLRPGTAAENTADREEHGKQNPSGHWSPRYVQLDDATVDAIREAYQPGVRGRTIRAVARRFDVDQAMVWQIVNFRGRWAVSA